LSKEFQTFDGLNDTKDKVNNSSNVCKIVVPKEMINQFNGSVGNKNIIND
jgi:hypothetical protein